ncbi:YraN family protein [Francisella philomiragia]|uniref:YraN family protein n=1 Tax=Francisella philomiragia TaxID=28110 RepID=UPI001C9D7A53|nr:YraN family protein [Francisella philomiragia]MBY7733984.1 YraN family protein [Francisella philomiragia]
MKTIEIGNKAEEQASKFLQAKNLEILAQNFKALPYGEIDIIALEQNSLVFIEVKYRSKTKFAKAEEMLTYSKQQKLINTAHIFLQQNPKFEDYECRFDLIAINKKDINWIKNAFISN